eukprot:Rhum_TRINITY_DN14790_c11_g2::Rhum_TRINITY_DN14790_c11_g2_i1::g.118090::m.118090
MCDVVEQCTRLPRSNSAPALSVPHEDWDGGDAGEEAEAEYRGTMEYARWYYSQTPRDPRVPPPIVTCETYNGIARARDGESRAPNMSVMDVSDQSAYIHNYPQRRPVPASFSPSSSAAQAAAAAAAASVPAIPSLVDDRETSDDEDPALPHHALHGAACGNVFKPIAEPLPAAGERVLGRSHSGLNSMAAPFVPGGGYADAVPPPPTAAAAAGAPGGVPAVETPPTAPVATPPTAVATPLQQPQAPPPPPPLPPPPLALAAVEDFSPTLSVSSPRMSRATLSVAAQLLLPPMPSPSAAAAQVAAAAPQRSMRATGARAA